MSEERKNDKEGTGEESKETLPMNNFKIRRSRVLLLFFVGLIVGVVLKTQAAKTITIGFDDYRLTDLKGDYEVQLPQVEEAVQSDEMEGELEEAPEN